MILKRATRRSTPALLSLLLLTGSTATRADSLHHREAEFASSPGLAVFIAAGIGSSLLQDGDDGKNHALRTLDAVATSGILAESLKHIVHERRPGSPTERDSFPSGHATLSFAVATMQSHYHPKQAPLWYLGAALISESRVELNRHHWHDVIGGAALGYLTAHYELKQRRGLLLSPIIRPDSNNGNQLGLQISETF